MRGKREMRSHKCWREKNKDIFVSIGSIFFLLTGGLYLQIWQLF